ncbi:uncharacterized protein LOC129796516 [Lutzomyia longipalpis]|uniref:uncharacterized protein LOC129796516 n=1 Tax=Lutzomyia longipalpis TaxID=7200 RepID=UPI002483E876|nr:uncharacterized protein LOC129796516 [Lutzomyia longipalpis]
MLRLCVSILFYIYIVVAEEVPDYLQICKQSDPDLPQCMIRSIEQLRPKLAEGIPELDIPRLEPIDLGDLLVAGSNTQNGLTITAKDIQSYGASNFHIKQIEVIEYGQHYKLQLVLPHLYTKGRYSIDGRVLLLPIKGAGKFTGNFTRSTADVTMILEPREISGNDHIILKKLQIKIKVGKGSMYLENLFGGDKTLGDIINDTINQNFEVVSRDIIPLIEKALEKHFKRTSNKILSRYTRSQLFEIAVHLIEDNTTNMQFRCIKQNISALTSLLVLLGGLGGAFGGDVRQLKEKPDWLLTCPRENPNRDGCFKKMFEGMFTALAKGVPEVGIEPFEPLRIPNVQISKGMGSLTLAGGFKDLLVRGPSNGTVRRALLNFDDKSLDFDLELPLLRINATYNLKGNVLLLPLVGNGDVKMALKDVKSNVVTKFSIKKLPEEVIQIDEMKVTFLVGGMKIHLDNLFNGNQILGASLNLFLNQNANEIIAELRSDLENGLAKIFITLWNSVFSRMPIKLWLI